MARMKFICDAERCIECNGCATACKNEHEVPWGVNRRRLVTINDGVPGERSISVACMHCTDAPCMAVCPVDCFYRTEDSIVLGMAVAFVACACHEIPQDAPKPYAGKEDTKAYAGDLFKGDKVKYEKALAVRANNQNEYLRTGDAKP